MNLSNIDQGRVFDAILKRAERLKSRIAELESKRNGILQQAANSSNPMQQNMFKAQAEHFNRTLQGLKDKLKIKEENYFVAKHPAYFYIEGDPIPKDFYEYYSALDSKIIDNIVSRKVTEGQTLATQENLDRMKIFLLVGIGAAVAAAILGLVNYNLISQVCKSMGLACKLF
jgi:hypothetical protein